MKRPFRIDRAFWSLFALFALGSQAQSPLVVTSTADTPTPTLGTLRYAINHANTTGCTEVQQTISFSITSGTAPWKIQPATALPAFSCPYGITVDGTTQSGWSANTGTLSNNANIRIELDGTNCAGCNGLAINGGYVTIKGLSIHSFNGGAGILATNGPVYIEGNYIGVTSAGVSARNGNFGIRFEQGGYGDIGKNTGQGDGNLISANTGGGIFVGAPLAAASGNEGFVKILQGPSANVYYNQIGSGRGGAAMANTGPGVLYVEASSSNNVASNAIRYNSGPGVQLRAGNGVHLHANIIHANTQTAFDLGSDGLPTENDTGDADSGPNDLRNKPEIISVAYSGAGCATNSQPCDTTIAAKVRSQATPFVRVDYFHNDASPAVPEGKFYLGSAEGFVGETGEATISVNIGGLIARNVTATATYDSCGECGYKTSEYSYPRMAPPTATASFSASSAPVGSTLTYKVEVSNSNAFAEMTGLAVNVTVPNGSNLRILSAVPENDCTSSGFYSNSSTTATLSGTGIPAGGKCTFTLTVYGNDAGTMTMGPSNVTVNTDAGSAPVPSVASFTAFISAPTLQLFVTSPVQAGGSTPLSIGVSRTSAQPSYSAMTVSLSLPGGGTIATPPVYGGCPSGTGSTATGGGVIAASNGSWSGNGVCEFVNTNVTFPNSGTYTVSIAPGAFTWRQGSSDTTFSNSAAVQADVTVQTPPGVSLSPASFNFGNVARGTTTATSITLTNTGGSTLSISSFSMTSGTPTFSIIGGAPATTCAATLAAGASCTIGVQFSPAAAGTYSGTLSVQSSAAGSPHVVSLSGSGTSPAVSLSTSLLAFGGVPVGTSKSLPLTVSNTGNANLTIGNLATSGSPAFSATGCAAAVAPGSSCTVNVTFTPSATTGYAGQLTFTSNASTSPHNVNLTGSGTAPGVGLSPSPLNFGSVALGSSSTSNVTLNNPGTAPLQVSAITMSGSVAFTVGNACIGTLAVQATCQIPVTFTPADANPQAASLSVQSNAAGSPHTVSLSGTGIAPGVSLTPTPVTFGNVPVGGSASSPLTLTNTGTAQLAISGIQTTGTFFSSTTTCGATLDPGMSCSIVVTYAPAAAGAHSGEVSVTTNAGASPVVAPLSGTGAVPVLALSSSSVDFGSQTVGSASLTQPVTLTNTGGAPLNLSAITVTGDFNFTGCPTPMSLAAGASCTLSIKFVPTAVGARSGGISIDSNASGSPHAIALTGNGTPVPVPGIALAPGSADFGALVVGANSTQVLMLSNPGTAPLAISSIGTTGAGFSQTNSCPASLAPSAACNISVTFAPAVEGAASGQLQIVSNAAPSPLTAALSGSGLAATSAGLTPSAGSVAFPPQFVGTTSVPQTVTLTSSGTAPLVISQVTGNGDFAFSGCGPSTLAPNATCMFSITFRPQAVGPLSGSIVVTSNASGSPHSISLSGSGASLTAPEIVMAPAAFAFGTLRTTRTATIVSRLSNTGAAPLVISMIQATGAFFAQSNNCPSTIPVGGFCDVIVTYSPTATGAHSGQLSIHSNAIPSPHVAALSGTGITVPPPFLSTSDAVNFGQQVTGTTVRRTLVITNTGGDPLVISSMALIGSGAFGVEGGCVTVAPEASCSLTLTFLPTRINTFNARLDIVSNHSGGAVQVQLSGQGVALPQPDLDFSVGALGFGNQGVNTAAPGPGSSVRLTNIGGAPVVISALRSTMPDYQISASQCVGTLAPQAFCDIGVVFRPTAPGPRQGSLVVDSNPAQADSVSLIGVGCRQVFVGRNQSPARLCSP